MEELRNPLLGVLNTEDLNQRYSDSYCLYFGEPKYIHNFTWNEDDLVIEYANINTGKNKTNPERKRFRWEGLNVARPQAGWYFADHTRGHNPFHLSYPVKRQYKRGLSTRNCLIYAPYGKLGYSGQYYESLLTSPDNYMNITDEVLDSGRSVIPRRDRLLHCNGHQWDFWFRNQCVARIVPQEEIIYFLDYAFTQELLEVNRSARLASFAREVAKPMVKVLPEEFDDPDDREPEDDFMPDHLVEGQDAMPLFVIADEDSAQWVISSLLTKVEAAIIRQTIGQPAPALRQVGTIIWERWNGIMGAGVVRMHYSQVFDVTRWLEAPDKKTLFSGFLSAPDGKRFLIGLFHSHNPGGPVNRKDDLYVLYQPAEA